jgi:hypothetical protein
MILTERLLTDRVRESIFLKPTNIAELTEICLSLKSGKASGCDDISMQVIKNTFEIISQPLVQIINLSLLNGYFHYFPNKLKIAKVIPIYKADSPEFFTNYRPISLLPNFSKCFEKVMHNRITNFIESFDILYSRQFGFRKKTFYCLITYLSYQ